MLRYRVRIIFLFTSICLLSACSPASDVDKVASGSDQTVYTNAVIWTGDESQPSASVMVVEDGRITYIGEQVPPSSDNATFVDLQKKFVIPGLIDNHVHFSEGGAGLAAVQLRDASSKEEFVQRIADFAATLAPDQWVLYGNWDHEAWGGELPNKAWIDSVTPDNPVFVMRLDGHMGFANSIALDLAAITAESVDPEGGKIERDANGEPTGVLKDTAMDAVLNAIAEPSQEERFRAINAAQEHAFKLGLTQVHVMTASPLETDVFDIFKAADEAGVLKIRTRVYSPLQNWQAVLEALDEYQYHSPRLTWGGFKGLTDGALGSTTAWFYEGYTDEPDNFGFPLIATGDLRTMVADANTQGIQLALHAIGDRAIDAVIDVIASVAGDDVAQRRFRIEHFQHPNMQAINRVAEHQIIASMQPYHAIDDGRWAEKRIGAERIKTTYAFNTILESGALLSFGSDWPVAPLNPLLGIYAATTRQTIDGANPLGWQPQEKVSVEQALRAYTSTNAYAAFDENNTGRLAVGMQADFVVLDEDLRTIDPTKISSVQVLKTVLGGNQVYSKDD